MPADSDVLIGQCLLQGALALQQADQRGGLLVADAQLLGGFGERGDEQTDGPSGPNQGLLEPVPDLAS
ncbi:hypothetical protein MDS_4648 [Ectopseudomonas mendocina NK-01]|nr:hypothetical protein MDS_4648 [Pseudomonas mendocina NK-01]